MCPDPPAETKETLQSLERGMAVIQLFSRERPALTVSEVAQLTGTTRASARRVLFTLRSLGHVRSDGRLFSLTPRVLKLGWAYLSSLKLSEIAEPLMEDLVRRTDESSSAGTLDLPDIVCVASVPARRTVTIHPAVGTRAPAHPTSLGRVLLAALPPDELDRYVAETSLERFTERTIVDAHRLRAILDEVREQGWALSDEEFEIGLRTLAVPIMGSDGRVVAALNSLVATPRVSRKEFLASFLPELRETAELISANLRGAQEATVAVS